MTDRILTALRALYVEGVQSGMERAAEVEGVCGCGARAIVAAREEGMCEAGVFFDSEPPDATEWPVLVAVLEAVTDELDGARSGALLLREEIDALRGMVEERDAEIERLRGLLGLVEEAQERIRARGNPLASLTSKEVRAARESDLPEICGRLAPVDRNGCYWPRCEYTHDGPPCDACDQAPRPDPADQAVS